MEAMPSRRTFLKNSLKTAGLVGLGAGGMILGEKAVNSRAFRNIFSSEERELEVSDGDYEQAVREIAPSAFSIEGRHGHGSGFIFAPGYILTNFHVTQNNHRTLEMRQQPHIIPFPLLLDPHLLLNIEAVNDPNYIATTFTSDDRCPGRSFRVAPVLLLSGARAHHKDMSLLRFSPDAGLPENARPVEFGTPRMGARVIILGMPYDSPGHVTAGRVARAVAFDKCDEPLWQGVPFVAVDGGLNPGNSGGPIFQLRKIRGSDGHVRLIKECIGMSTYTHRGAQGLGGGIRSDYLRYVGKTRWGLPLMTDEEVTQYRRDFPTAA